MIEREKSLRMLFDMQACQTEGSANRGVGRFSKSFYSAIRTECVSYDLWALVSEQLPFSVDVRELLPEPILHLPSLPAWGVMRDYEGGSEDSLDALAFTTFTQTLKPDVIHVSHVFEGFTDRVALPSPVHGTSNQVISATLYDFIPLLFQEHYFQDKNFKKWYMSRIKWLRQADLLLAISESTRKDAIQLLGIEPWRVVTIHGGISECFKPPKNRNETRLYLSGCYLLREKVVLYTGGDDYRKNIRGVIEGYAMIPSITRKISQLVIVCSMEQEQKKMYLDFAKGVGLNNDDILITGYISEQDLVAFYSICDVFIFPSLYEGLGLPVLEAMACGAPVIGGDNSSIKEIIARDDALFDARSPNSIAEIINNVLTNKSLSDDLRKYGLERVKEFSWEKTAKLAREAFDEALKRKHLQNVEGAKSRLYPCKRLAVLSPLPPLRSGIADYNSQFIPFLSRHFDIDLYVENYKVKDEYLTSAFRIFDVKDFETVAESYDVILYEFGNSQFHNHMLPLLEKFPGIVGLHDAFLSGMMGYFDFNLGQSGFYIKEMLSAHGPRARRLFAPCQEHPDPVGTAMVDLPCTKRILDNAIGIISHSPFNLDVARANYAEGWLAPYKIINQMVLRPESVKSEMLSDLRKELNFVDGDFIITTFGHITWTKWGDRLLDAFLQIKQNTDSKIYLVFAGELSADDFGNQLSRAVKKSGISKNVRITGYLSETDYKKYLRISDLAIQLRTKSRGGTPKGVLDCLAYGVPVMVNNDASYIDYPENVVIKLVADPSVNDISVKISELLHDRVNLFKYKEAGRYYIEEKHNPSDCAAEYAAAINDFVEKQKINETDNKIKDFAPYLMACEDVNYTVKSVVNWVVNSPVQKFKRRRIFIDVSHIAQYDHNTGIQRTVKKIVHELYCTNRTGLEPVAVVLVEGQFVPAYEWLGLQGLLMPYEILEKPYNVVEFRHGDTLLMLDSSWERFSEFELVFHDARLANVPIVTVIYDILPITLPEGNFVEGGREWFKGWLQKAIKSSDEFVCISQAVADDVIGFLTETKQDKEVKKIGYWHLGADFTNDSKLEKTGETDNALDNINYLLMVGTIEPRKSHELALDAMEKLWAKGSELALCIVGKPGWMVENLMERLRKHPLLGQKLFLYEGVADEKMSELYKNSVGLLFLSKGEGYGLPLIEAAHYGTAIICSDIPVFKEVAGDFATYTDIKNSKNVADSIYKWWEQFQNHEVQDTKMMKYLTWEQSAENLLETIIDNNWYWSG